MATKVKKDQKPFIFTGDKYIFKLPKQIKDYYTILVDKLKDKSFIQKYWDNIFPNKPSWSEIWSTRVKPQSDKK